MSTKPKWFYDGVKKPARVWLEMAQENLIEQWEVPPPRKPVKIPSPDSITTTTPLRLEVAAKILRMGQQRLQPIFGVNARHARFTNSLELWNEPMRIGGTLAQQPQPFGSSGRQPLDHVELRLEMYPSGKRLRVRGSGFEAHVSPPMMIGDTR